MTLQKQIDDLLAQQASQWVDTLRHGSAEDFAAFVAWVSESPRNLDEFLTIATIDSQLERQDLYAGIDRDALFKQVASRPVVELQRPQRAQGKTARQQWRLKRRTVGSLVAGIAVIGLLGFAARHAFTPSQEFKTEIGELRSLELPDGSLVYLNAQSAVKLRFDETLRGVDLIRGDALFNVARDTSRAFEVRTRDAVVKALGTEFNVSARDTGTQVAVLEGRVQVSSTERTHRTPSVPAALGRGDEAEIARSTGHIQIKQKADVNNAVAWRQRRLVFAQAPLEQIVREFNRFNRLQLRLEDVQPRAHHYSGTFDADDPDGLIAYLSREPDLSVQATGDEIVIRAR